MNISREHALLVHMLVNSFLICIFGINHEDHWHLAKSRVHYKFKRLLSQYLTSCGFTQTNYVNVIYHT